MKYTIYSICMFVILMALASLSPAQAPLGDWEGSADMGPQSLKLVFHIKQEGGKLIATMDSPDQAAYGIAMDKASFEDPTLILGISQLGFTYEGKLNAERNKIVGKVSQMGQSFPATLTLGSAAGPPRPQTPQPPFPYSTTEVNFENVEDGIKLAGTLSIPEGKGPFPAVVLISGSGPQDRDESIMQHKPFWVIADAFGREGIAVLRFDDRGIGESEGDFEAATSREFARDAHAAFEYLKKQKNIDPSKLGLIGHSEGGIVAPLLASRDSSISFLITLAGPSLPGKDIILMQLEAMLDKSGLGKDLIGKNLQLQDSLLATVMAHPDNASAEKRIKEKLPEWLEEFSATEKAMLGITPSVIEAQIPKLTSDWYRNFLGEDPLSYIEKLNERPFLALYGSNDLQVPARQNLEALSEVMQENPYFTGKVYPGLNHLFQHSQTGLVQEYGKITETISEEVLEDMVAWIRKR